MNIDYERVRIKDISRTDVKLLVIGLIEELHKDCGQRIDEELLQHTTLKFSDLLGIQFATWHWGDIRRLCQNGIAGGYGGKSERINYQTLLTWMKRAQKERGSNYAEKEIQDSKYMNNLTVGDWGSKAMRWREFQEYMTSKQLWFLDNISLKNCDAYHTAVKNGTLDEFISGMNRERDPEYFERMRKITLEQFKSECNVFN